MIGDDFEPQFKVEVEFAGLLFSPVAFSNVFDGLFSLH